MKIAFLFPGQGAQTVGMGKDLYEKYEEVRNIYNKVKDITGIDIAKISFEGPDDLLVQTKYTQLAILTESLAILEVLKKENINSEISAGLSLGEYTALINSKALDIDEGIKLIQKRGTYMQELLPEGNWKMAAVLGMDASLVEDACKKVKNGFAVPANYNCEGQIVISGDEEGITEAESILKEMNAKRVTVLNTSGPFHTSRLDEASNALREYLKEVTFNKFESKVVKNIDGKVYSDSDDLKDILANHIVNPVRFSTSIETMLKEGIDTFIEIGPGKTLSGFIKRTPKDVDVNILNISNVETLESTINFIKEGQN